VRRNWLFLRDRRIDAHAGILTACSIELSIAALVRLEVMELRASLRTALAHPAVQSPLALALLVPLAATAGQFWASGFWRQSPAVGVLFWPGAAWHWAPHLNAAAVMAVMAALYVAGISRLYRARTLAVAVAVCIGAVIAAQLIRAAVNRLTGWHEIQLGSMDVAGKVNQFLLAQWHNPLWEETVFRGIPLLAYGWLAGKAPRAAAWCYFLVPSLAMAAYHVPGHGYARITDTFLLALFFAWLALRYSFWAALVLHSILDAIWVLGLGHAPYAPAAEVGWLADTFGVWNTAWTLSTGAALVAPLTVLVLRAAARRRPAAPDSVRISSAPAAPRPF